VRAKIINNRLHVRRDQISEALAPGSVQSRHNRDAARLAGAWPGDITADETALITGWPASIVQGTKGEKGEVNIPGDIRLSWFNIILPPGAAKNG